MTSAHSISMLLNLKKEVKSVLPFSATYMAEVLQSSDRCSVWPSTCIAGKNITAYLTEIETLCALQLITIAKYLILRTIWSKPMIDDHWEDVRVMKVLYFVIEIFHTYLRIKKSIQYADLRRSNILQTIRPRLLRTVQTSTLTKTICVSALYQITRHIHATWHIMTWRKCTQGILDLTEHFSGSLVSFFIRVLL